MRIGDGDSIPTCLSLPDCCTRQLFTFLFYLYFTVGNSKNTFLFIEEGKEKFSYFDDSFRHNSYGSPSNIQNKLDRQALLAEVSNNSYAIPNYTAVYQAIRSEPSIILKKHSYKISREMKRLYSMMNLTAL